jgi:hypothetical protein
MPIVIMLNVSVTILGDILTVKMLHVLLLSVILYSAIILTVILLNVICLRFKRHLRTFQHFLNSHFHTLCISLGSTNF